MRTLHNLFPRVAIVTDQMTAFGGADRELYSMLQIFPKAEIYTTIFYPGNYPTLKNKVHTTIAQKLTKIFGKNFYRHLKVLNPLLYENMDLRGYDLVISVSAGPGKSVITGIDQIHIARVLTPPRTLWDMELNVRGSRFKFIYKPISRILNTYLRVWDYSISKRVDYWCVNSEFIRRKVKKTYSVDSTVIYPGVHASFYEDISPADIKKVKKKFNLPEEFFLVVSRLYEYKRVDLAVNACIQAKKELYIVGDGPDKKYLEKLSKNHNNIHILGYLTDNEIRALYKTATSLLFCGIEDFGLVPVEAMASGTPVFAYGYGGLTETVQSGISGEFFKTENELISLLKNSSKSRYNRRDIKKIAEKFSEERFILNLRKYFLEVYEKEKSNKAK